MMGLKTQQDKDSLPLAISRIWPVRLHSFIQTIALYGDSQQVAAKTVKDVHWETELEQFY